MLERLRGKQFFPREASSILFAQSDRFTYGFLLGLIVGDALTGIRDTISPRRENRKSKLHLP